MPEIIEKYCSDVENSHAGNSFKNKTNQATGSCYQYRAKPFKTKSEPPRLKLPTQLVEPIEARPKLFIVGRDPIQNPTNPKNTPPGAVTNQSRAP